MFGPIRPCYTPHRWAILSWCLFKASLPFVLQVIVADVRHYVRLSLTPVLCKPLKYGSGSASSSTRRVYGQWD
ncbi:hypothetical protein F4680DRAFT_116243 [Xylaria scruposa]|nr:hypothetical protein F4680DRAFT_116243 [Xylaria scruposa]